MKVCFYCHIYLTHLLISSFTPFLNKQGSTEGHKNRDTARVTNSSDPLTMAHLSCGTRVKSRWL